jgi:hypothetical protein
MDPRFQEAIEWLRIAVGLRHGEFDRVSLAGGGGQFERFREFVQFAVEQHGAREIVLVGHEDCRGGTTLADMSAAARSCRAQFPGVRVRLFWLHLDGRREELAFPAAV